MYKSLNIAQTIKLRAKERGVPPKVMLSDLSLGSNTMSNMRHDKMIAADSLARIAGYLDCSVDYLLGRTDRPEINHGSDQSSAEEKYGQDAPKPDLEATVHVYDFRMTLDEMLPARFKTYANDMRSYALVANGLTYMQRIGKDTRYIQPDNVTDVAEYLELLLQRGIFVDLLSDKEVFHMTLTQFSREEALRYQSWEEGIDAAGKSALQGDLTWNTTRFEIY